MNKILIKFTTCLSMLCRQLFIMYFGRQFHIFSLFCTFDLKITLHFKITLLLQNHFFAPKSLFAPFHTLPSKSDFSHFYHFLHLWKYSKTLGARHVFTPGPLFHQKWRNLVKLEEMTQFYAPGRECCCSPRFWPPKMVHLGPTSVTLCKRANLAFWAK